VQEINTPCPPLNTYSALFDVRSLDPAGILLKLSKEYGPADVLTFYGSLDSTATSASANLTLLGTLTGNNGNAGGGLFTDGWPYLIAHRDRGSVVGGNINASGNSNGTGATLAPPSVALPALNAFSPVLDLAPLAGTTFYVGLSENQTSRDQFNLYGTNDATAGGPSLAAGGQLLGTIQGGDGTAPGTILQITGFKYLFIQRTAGSTAGSVLAWGTSVVTGGGGGAVSSVTGIGPIIASPTTGAVVVSAPSLGSPTTNNKNMVALTTVADAQQATATAIAVTPKGYVRVYVNGAAYDAGDTVLGTVCFFGPNATTAHAQGSIVAGDLLWWNGSVAGFQLDTTTDILDFDYNA
jgi:hypothetical protein